MRERELDFELNEWTINLLRRIDGPLAVLKAKGLKGPGHRVSKCSGGYPVDYELWETLLRMQGEMFMRGSPMLQTMTERGQEEVLARFPTVESVENSTVMDALRFFQAALWIPFEGENLDVKEFRKLIRKSKFGAVYESGRFVAALQRVKDLTQPTRADLRAILAYKSIFDSLTVDQFRSWNGWEPWEIEPGVQVLHVPYPDYHPVVQQWNVAVYCTPFYIDPYREVPGKEHGVPPPRFLGIGARGNPSPQEFFRDADLDEVRQYMAVCLRGEKWCTGHIAGEFERGVIQASLVRLGQLISTVRTHPAGGDSCK